MKDNECPVCRKLKAVANAGPTIQLMPSLLHYRLTKHLARLGIRHTCFRFTDPEKREFDRMMRRNTSYLYSFFGLINLDLTRRQLTGHRVQPSTPENVRIENVDGEQRIVGRM